MSNSYRPSMRGTRPFMRQAALLLLCFLATLAATPVQAAETQVAIKSASLALDADQDVYALDATATIELPEDARKAIEAGLTLKFGYEIELSRVRRYMPDATLASLVQSYELSYHALSQRYLLRNLNTGEQADFGTLQSALDALASVHDLPVIDAALLSKDSSYEGHVRASVDMSTVPEALRWMLFWSDDWSASSEWYTWPLRR